MFCSSGLQCRLLRVALFLLCFGRAPSYRLLWHLLHYHCGWKALHSQVLGITQNSKWKLFSFGWPRVVFEHSLHNILSIRFLSSLLEWLIVVFLVTLLSRFLKAMCLWWIWKGHTLSVSAKDYSLITSLWQLVLKKMHRLSMFWKTLPWLIHLFYPSAIKFLKEHEMSVSHRLSPVVKLFSLTSIVVLNPKHDLCLIKV